MPIRPILTFPDPRLRTIAKPVTTFDDALQTLVNDMLATMYDAKGIGLAATQINVHQQVIVMDLSEDKSQPQVFINPHITVRDNTLTHYDEGCLSVPGFYESIARPAHVSIDAYQADGTTFTQEAKGMLAVCIQHEIDHLNGMLFVDHLSALKRQRIRDKIKKNNKKKR